MPRRRWAIVKPDYPRIGAQPRPQSENIVVRCWTRFGAELWMRWARKNFKDNPTLVGPPHGYQIQRLEE